MSDERVFYVINGQDDYIEGVSIKADDSNLLEKIKETADWYNWDYDDIVVFDLKNGMKVTNQISLVKAK